MIPLRMSGFTAATVFIHLYFFLSTMQVKCSWSSTGDEPVDVNMLSVKYSCSFPLYIFIAFPCTSFLKISYCVNVLSGACTHHGLLLSIHFHKAVANSTSLILIGLIFVFIFCFLRSVVSQQASSQLPWISETSKQGRCFYHMLSGLVLPHACLLLQDSEKERERETLRSWWAWRKDKKKNRKKGKKHLHSWNSREERVLRQNVGSWRWNPLRDSKSESEWSVDLQRLVFVTASFRFIQCDCMQQWLKQAARKAAILICRFLHS